METKISGKLPCISGHSEFFLHKKDNALGKNQIFDFLIVLIKNYTTKFQVEYLIEILFLVVFFIEVFCRNSYEFRKVTFLNF